MEDSKESIRLDLVYRAIPLGLAVVATGLLFTSVAVVFTAGAGAAGPAADVRVAQATVADLPGA